MKKSCERCGDVAVWKLMIGGCILCDECSCLFVYRMSDEA